MPESEPCVPAQTVQIDAEKEYKHHILETLALAAPEATGEEEKDGRPKGKSTAVTVALEPPPILGR